MSIENLKHEYSNAGLVGYYLWGNINEPYTLFKNIKSIKRGTCLIIEGNGNEKILDYANIKNLILNTEKINFKNEIDKLSYLRDIIEETVNYHHVSDVPRTVLLSSGIDSNAILASMNADNKKIVIL